MNLVITEDVFNADDPTLRILDQITDRVEDGVHRLEIRDADQLKESRFFQDARSTRQKFLLAVASRPPAHRTSRRTHLSDVVIDSPSAALRAKSVAYTPLTILVEDREADGILLEILVEKQAPRELRELWDAAFKAVPVGLEFVTSGGVNAMPQRVSRMLAEVGSGRALRLIVVCDSDTRWPGDTGSSSQTSIDELQALCAGSGITCHVLNKRTAENYIPDEVFVAASRIPANLSNKPRFEAFLRRTSSQRDHFPVKDGMGNEERDLVLDEGFYLAAEEGDLDLLRDRLFPKRPRLMLQLHKEYLGAFTLAGLRDRDGIGEIDALLNIIAVEL